MRALRSPGPRLAGGVEVRGWAGLLIAGWLALAGSATAGPLPYLFRTEGTEDLAGRFAPPAGAMRTTLAEGSFGDYLRHLPLLPAGTAVHLYNGRLKGRQDVHAAVVDLDVGQRDLQQCADAVMRLRSEYLFAAGRQGEIRFHPDPGKPRTLAFTGGKDRAALGKYLVRVFVQAGSASLQAELRPIGKGPVQPGDVLIKGGYPGHALLVLDVAQGKDGKAYLLLGQSYMPAQQFHVVKDLEDQALSPWFDAGALDEAGVQTPEWPPFRRKDVRRFPDHVTQ